MLNKLLTTIQVVTILLSLGALWYSYKTYREIEQIVTDVKEIQTGAQDNLNEAKAKLAEARFRLKRAQGILDGIKGRRANPGDADAGVP